MFEQNLTEAGLTKEQAFVYEALIKHGASPARSIKQYVPLSRPLVYKVLGQLIGLGLAEKRASGKSTTLFAPLHPIKLKTFADKQIEQAEHAKSAVDGVLSKLISDFNTISGQPGIRILEGASGVAELYEDILNERQDICIIRSVLNYNDLRISDLVERQIQEQVRSGIKTRTLTPILPDTTTVQLEMDAKNLVERRLVHQDMFETPAQTIIYANKVALTSFAEPVTTTIIENEPIAKTFRAFFDYMWRASEKEHKDLQEKVATRGK